MPELYEDGTFILRYRMSELKKGLKMPGSTEFVFLGLQDFDKKYDELETYPEKWLYCMREAASLTEAPSGLTEEAQFETFFSRKSMPAFSSVAGQCGFFSFWSILKNQTVKVCLIHING